MLIQRGKVVDHCSWFAAAVLDLSLSQPRPRKWPLCTACVASGEQLGLPAVDRQLGLPGVKSRAVARWVRFKKRAHVAAAQERKVRE